MNNNQNIKNKQAKMKSDCIKHMPEEAQKNLIEFQLLIIQKWIKKSLLIGFSIGVALTALLNTFL